MNSSQNSTGLRSSISAILSNKEKFQNPTKPQDLATMKISEATPNQYTTLILMAAGHQKIGREILEHLCRKDIRELSTKDLHKAAKEAEHQIITKATTEGLTHSNLCTSCITAALSTTALKLPHLSRDKKENGARFRTTFASIHTPRSQSHHAVGSPPPTIFPTLPFAFSATTNHNNQTQSPAYDQSYHYATTNHPQPSPAPQITYPLPVPQITYPMPNNTNPQVKTETNPPPPPSPPSPPQI
jgi:hypothetical protein